MQSGPQLTLPAGLRAMARLGWRVEAEAGKLAQIAKQAHQQLTPRTPATTVITQQTTALTPRHINEELIRRLESRNWIKSYKT